MSNYWNSRLIRERNTFFNLTSEQLEAFLRKYYIKIYREIASDLKELFLKLPEDKTLSELYKEDRYYKLLTKLQARLTSLGEVENIELEEGMKKMYVGTQEMLSVDALNPIITDEKVLEAVNSIWCADGLNFSDRIWKDKERLIENLKTGLINTVAKGDSWGELSKQIKSAFDVSFNDARRLVRTELTHIQNQSTIDKYINEGITKVRYIAEPDCCEHCREHSNKVFKIENVPDLPMHPNCRCAIIPIIED